MLKSTDFQIVLGHVTMSVIDDLLDDIFDGKHPTLYPEFETWVRGMRRFREFAITYRTKIRAKLRHVRDENGMADLRAELETAMLLLQEKRFTLEYEKYTAAKQRGPDYTVTFKTHTPFNVEVRHIRNVEIDDDTDAPLVKLMAVLCDKVGQMPPSIINLLWLNAESDISESDLNAVLTTLRGLSEQKDDDFFTARGYESATHFLKQFRQLSGIVLRQSDELIIWQNALARHKTLPDIVRAIERLPTS